MSTLLHAADRVQAVVEGTELNLVGSYLSLAQVEKRIKEEQPGRVVLTRKRCRVLFAQAQARVRYEQPREFTPTPMHLFGVPIRLVD